jgi:hypothetical protein
MSGFQSPTSMALTASPEVLLIAAVLQQAWHDVTSANGDIRHAAEKFWSNTDEIRPLADILDLDVDALTEAASRRRQQRPDA